MNRSRLRLIFPSRSDGTGEKPPASKLQKVTEKGGIVRWLEEVTRDEAKSRDWRKKLGQMLVQEAEKKLHDEGKANQKIDNDEGTIYMLHDFPDGYTLYEQHTIKPSAKEGGQPEERRDAYLYGHPGGEKKRFRTPKEFFEHLWWLSTDEQGDPNNCTCPRCVPEDLHKEVEEYVTGKPAETKSTKSKPPVKREPTPASAAAQTPPVSQPAAQVIASVKNTPSIAPPSSETPVLVTAAPKPPPHRPTSSGRAAPKSHLAPSQPPQPRNQEQAEDAQNASYLYRVGEVIWFQKGAAWGLGILQERSRKVAGNKQEHNYIVQPLSYPGANCERVGLSSETQLKPWYAYSPPNATHARLNQPDAINRAFNEIPWSQVVSGSLGPGEAEVDASIYAAKTVDRSFTPIDRTHSVGNRTYYNGVFIGAEKVWCGDAVRLRSAANSLNPEILIITDIVETVALTQVTGPDRLAPRDSILFVGDRYTFAQIPVKVPPGEADPQQYLANRIPTRIPTLPDRVAEDLMKQNRVSVLRHQMANSWRLVATKQQVHLSDVRGRWYESLRMLPIINPPLYQQAVTAGQIPDVGRSLNARCDSEVLVDGSPGFRFSHREAVLGGSVPPTFKLPSVVHLGGAAK